VDAPVVDKSASLMTPLRVGWLIFLITIVLAVLYVWKPSFSVWCFWKWVLIGIQTIAGLWIMGVIFLTKQLPSSSAILIVLFNILPALCWRWRKYWQLPYAILLLAGVITLWLWPHMLVDPFYVVITLSYIVIFASEPIKGCWNKRWIKE